MKADSERAFFRAFPKIHKDIQAGLASPNEIWLREIFDRGYEERRKDEEKEDERRMVVSDVPGSVGAECDVVPLPDSV